MTPNFWRTGLSLPLAFLLLAAQAAISSLPARAAPGDPSGPVLAHPSVVPPYQALPLLERSAAGRVYYVDARKGDDDAPGTSARKAWRSLDRANGARLRPGDTLLFRRDGRWKGTLTLRGKGTSARRITVGAYGKGARPKITGRDGDCVVVKGSYLRISDLRASDCQWGGFRVDGRHNDLWDVYADRNVAGIWVTERGSRNTIRHSQIIGNDRMSVNDGAPDNDSGAFGVLLNGDDNRVVGNLIAGSYAASQDYVADGAAVEVYDGDRNVVSHNVSRDNETFTELGHSPDRTAKDNLFANNVVTSSRKRGSFLITRGPGHVVGPVSGTTAVNNSVYLPARKTIGVSCADGCSPKILVMRNNAIKVGGTAMFEDGSGIDDAGGVYDGRASHFKPGRRTIRRDPGFRSRRDLRLRPGAPAIGQGVPLGPSWFGGAALAVDAAGRSIPRSKNPDAGAYQY
ncbi:right-handed parallel beta-helix repeat-containing protein [Sphaerisporangium corydalis]|uniref:Right-handed parallel beta-helix repeat-containing protein n=1 Tax=Sphaerisporangium corydalis TaxID=1441875 RepID=A0ABV9ECD0_9ACTN|nr:right-handed parallel beta-helix repeat-containing protein [Sphaerisporangium corydalis]